MSASDLIIFFKHYGINGVILFILLFVIMGIIKTDWFTKMFAKYFDKLLHSKGSKIGIEESHIINHNMFNYIDFWVYSKVPTLKFASDYKTVIFRKYLSILLLKYKQDMQNYIASKVYIDMDDSELWRSILSLLNKIILDYEKEMEEVGIPKMVIEKMKEKNNTTVTLIIDLTESICSSEFYESKSNLLKIYSIQNILLSVLQNAITNSISVCGSINGDLCGQFIIVDGKKITEKKADKE